MKVGFHVTTTRSHNPHDQTEDKAVLHRQLLWHLCKTGQSHDGDSTCTHTHTLPQNYTRIAFRYIRRQSIFALAGIECTYNQLYSAVEKSLCTYKRWWKWCPRASIQAWTRLILFANTFCRSASESRCALIKGVGSDVHNAPSKYRNPHS
jgi:hypothetical protein